jgi:hypothetical protein
MDKYLLKAGCCNFDYICISMGGGGVSHCLRPGRPPSFLLSYSFSSLCNAYTCSRGFFHWQRFPRFSAHPVGRFSGYYTQIYPVRTVVSNLLKLSESKRAILACRGRGMVGPNHTYSIKKACYSSLLFILHAEVFPKETTLEK